MSHLVSRQLQYYGCQVQMRLWSTVTYYGFADFTTLVGDSVIVFSPKSSQASPIAGHVTSIKGMATLSTVNLQTTRDVNLKSLPEMSPTATETTKPFLSIDVTKDKEDKLLSITSIPSLKIKTVESSEISTSSQNIKNSAQYPNNKPMFSLPTDQEILEIYASLSKAQAQVEDQVLSPTSSQHIYDNDHQSFVTHITDEKLPVHGATTVFIDDDPFANFVKPSTVEGAQLVKSATFGDETKSVTEDSAYTSQSNTVDDNDIDNTTTMHPTANNVSDIVQAAEKFSEIKQVVTLPILDEVNEDGNNINSEDCDKLSTQMFLTQRPKTVTAKSQNMEFSVYTTYDIEETTKYYCIRTTQTIQFPHVETSKPIPVVMQSKNEPLYLNTATTNLVDEESITGETITEETITEETITDEPITEETITEETVTEETITEETITGDTGQKEESFTKKRVDVVEASTIRVPTMDDHTEPDFGFDSEDYDTENGSDEIDLLYKTLYTTYTYLTTFFQGKSTTVSSHTEVVTNIITSTIGTEDEQYTKHTDVVGQISANDISITRTEDTAVKTIASSSKYTIPEDLESILHASLSDSVSEIAQQTTYLDDIKYTKTYYTTYTYYTTIFAEGDISTNTHQSNLVLSPTGYLTETTGGGEKAITNYAAEGQREEHTTLVTDVRSSSSNGKQEVIGKKMGLVDDQTSFTTFTFYTTMYVSDSTNIVSSLETVTNIATETLQPTKMLSLEDASLPITYFTTFTYWTKLAKDGEITTISREETISNVIDPLTKSEKFSTVHSSEAMSTTAPTFPLNSLDNNDNIVREKIDNMTSVDNSPLVYSMSSANIPELTTYYTTYTYYTTSYEANKTVTDSRFETITNIVTPTIQFMVTTTPSQHQHTNNVGNKMLENSTSNIFFYDYKHIIDADQVSTLYFTTRILSTLNIEGNPVELTSSSSSLYINETKKSNLAIESTNAAPRQYKTGLVRLIEGTRIGNKTTTLYQSKVIGTIIESRYAQIIESTSSFLFEKDIPIASNLLPSSVTNYETVVPTKIVNLQSSGMLEGSIYTNKEIETEGKENHTELTAEEDVDDDGEQLLQTKKRTFAPVIRPFASRNRPTFAPKQKTLSPSSATIITRSDITPTITATPALKTIGRFSSSRRGGVNNPNDASLIPSSSRRLFGRPLKPSSSAAFSLITSSNVQSSSGFNPSRNRFASSSRATGTILSRRLSINSTYRPSSAGNFRPSVLGTGSSKLRIKPTSANSLWLSSTATTNAIGLENLNDDVENSTDEQNLVNEENETTTENARRNQNPILRFRRPLNRPSGFTPIPRPNLSSTNNLAINNRKSPLTSRAKQSSPSTTTTTTAKPRTRNFQRPTVSSFQARARPQNNLYPPRGLFLNTQNRNVNQSPKYQIDTVSDDTIKTEKDVNSNIDSDYEYDDDDDERRRKRSSIGSVFNLSNQSRVRRQVSDSLNRSKFRFRRPKTIQNEEPSSSIRSPQSINEPIENMSSTSTQMRAKINSRFGSRYQSQAATATSKQERTTPSSLNTSSHRSIRPTRPTSARTQFTLREKDTANSSGRTSAAGKSNFRRQQASTLRRPSASSGTSSASSNGRRLKNFSNTNNNNNNLDISRERLSGSGSRSRNSNVNVSNRGRGSSRSRNRNDHSLDGAMSDFGSEIITVTHVVPSETTVPVVNGQVTEYKNIVTGKTSIEVLRAHQYTQIVGNNGLTSIYLTREDTSVNLAGVTELTRYLLHDSATTSVTFTPTMIRGRKTSFSHVLPSTVYSVENIVSTVQPQISANAPLANILLSQLLLGNINLPGNPLLSALGGQPQATQDLVVATPVTEYRTHTSTYVTTIFDGKSTVLPITFQGKKILTTVFDTTAQTITATEYSVDTIINTPLPVATQKYEVHAASQVAQVNSLLLQQLLLQQQQPQLPQLTQLPGATHTIAPQILLGENLQDIDEHERGRILHDGVVDDILSPIGDELHANKNNRKKMKKTGHKGNKRIRPQPASAQPVHEEESSVITLYVSGRRPGEFSTILSTVYNSYDHSASLQKRQAYVQIQSTAILSSSPSAPNFETSEREQSLLPYYEQERELRSNSIGSNFDQDNSKCEQPNCETKTPTASLESIIGDVGVWYTKTTKLSDPTVPSASQIFNIQQDRISHNKPTQKYFLA
ncbi:CG33978 [Drosophila busckii]|uniref:CG33978 n=1 Tax=Drosophila busckii TaxID=30019 RepID=A0A0M4EWW0_DROBS|nr:CG33978 [Drosophila busckii]